MRLQLARATARVLVIATACCASGSSLAQAGTKVARVGVLSGPAASSGHNIDAFVKGLNDLGYSEGRNLLVERRWGDGRDERYRALAAELVTAKVDVIFAPFTQTVKAARSASTTMPIVFAVAADPIGDKFIASLQRPGGNLTGLTIITGELVAKRFELLTQAFPKVSRVGFLHSSVSAGKPRQLAEVGTAAARLRKDLLLQEVARAEDLERAFEDLRRQRVEAIVVNESPMFFRERTRIAQLATKAGLPAIYGTRDFAAAGGLMSYGADYTDLYRRAATYVDKILKGAKPGDLPVEQPTVFELVVNLRSAKASGIAVPHSILQRADVVMD